MIEVKLRAVKYHQFGTPSNVLYVANADEPILKADEVLIRMQLRSINPSDLLTIKGRYPSRIILPAIPGYEGVGIIVQKGKAVSDLSLGQRVLGLGGMWSYSSYVSSPFPQATHTS